MGNYLLWMILILSVLTTLTVPIERTRYKKLKQELEAPFEKRDISTSIALLASYNNLHQKDHELFRAALVHLKTQKEQYAHESLFDDILKMVSSIIPILAIVVSLTVTVFKDTLDTLVTFFGAVLEITSCLFIAIIFITFVSRIYIFSYRRATSLINKHLIMAEEVERHPQESKIYIP
ncbi:hypothetical protein MHB84_23000 [Paenibacillus sp. FSL F4-0087]|uniref:hypothetical protein n=1 Tax=Paenibacillus sp. FSL F4-0087 TaxID=2921368 RepID=UPI00096F15BC|nr:hypothetical protein BK122_27515 [Paenibacillus pabuli]